MTQSVVNSFLRKRLRPLLLLGIVTFVIIEVVALSPSTLEEGRVAENGIDPESLSEDAAITLAPGIPKNEIPEYIVEQFEYVSTKGTEKQWKLTADKAFLYKQGAKKLVHTRTVRALLYDPDGKTTVVTGNEAKYQPHLKDLEIYGSVRTVFPDGFELKSEYLKYQPDSRDVEIPQSYFVEGMGSESKDGHRLSFESFGLSFPMNQSRINLHRTVKVTFENKRTKEENESKTVIESDRCEILRDKQIAHFTMLPNRPLATRFVRITQPDLNAKGRRAELNYGDYDQVLKYLIAYDDVFIKERKAKGTLRYGTGGRADFDDKSNTIILTEFPQVYENKDTVTGDKIIVHRDTDVIEVDHSNAYSEGTKQ